MRPSSQTCCAWGSEGLEKLPPPQGFGGGGHHSPQPVRVREMGRWDGDQLRCKQKHEDEFLTADGGWRGGQGGWRIRGVPAQPSPLFSAKQSWSVGRIWPPEAAGLQPPCWPP